jgi:hypothetical protein
MSHTDFTREVQRSTNSPVKEPAMNAKWMIAIASLSIPFAIAQNPAPAAPQGEESKLSQPAETATKGKAPAKPVKMTPEQQKMLENTGSGKREIGTYQKKTGEQKVKDAADAKTKRTGITPEDQEKQKKSLPGGN